MEDKKETLDLGFAKLDLQREARCGFPEVVYCAGKTVGRYRFWTSSWINMTMSSARGLIRPSTTP